MNEWSCSPDPPSLPASNRGGEHDTVLFFQIMPQRPSCADCPDSEFIHSCRNYCPQPLCKKRHYLGINLLHYCIKAAQAWCREDRSKRCSIIRKKRDYWSIKAYKINPFSKHINMIDFQCIIGASEKHIDITDHDSLWPKSFLLKVCDTALKSSHPYEVFKLANQFSLLEI